MRPTSLVFDAPGPTLNPFQLKAFYWSMFICAYISVLMDGHLSVLHPHLNCYVSRTEPGHARISEHIVATILSNDYSQGEIPSGGSAHQAQPQNEPLSDAAGNQC